MNVRNLESGDLKNILIRKFDNVLILLVQRNVEMANIF